MAPRHLLPFGGTFPMPKLAAVAASGTVYDDAITTSPVSRPAIVTILTGVTPDRSGVRDNIHDALPSTLPTLGEDARKAGFETAAFVSTPFVSYASGLQRGFDLFDGPEAQVIGPAQFYPPVIAAAEVAGHFQQWLAARDKGKPFFAWIHLADLNGLATPPPGSAGSSVTKSGDPLEDYDKTLGAIDEAIGAIVSAVKSDPEAAAGALTIVATHSPYLGERGRRGDAFWLADETLRVPLVHVAHVSDPAADPQSRDPRATWLPDVAASLRQAFGVTTPPGGDGIPLDVAPPAGRARLAWTYAPDDQLAWPPLTAVKEGNTYAVFSTATDGTLQPAGDVSPSAATTARARPALARRRVLPEANRAAVERLGFKLGPSGAAGGMPKDVDPWLRDLQVVRGFMSHLRPRLAARSAQHLLDASPDSVTALVTRLVILSATPSEEARALRDRLLARYPDRSDALHWSAHVSLLDLNYDRAAALLDAAIAVGPVEPEMYYDRACVYVLAGDQKSALAELDTAIRAGYRNWDWFDKDPDLAALRTNPAFVELLRTHGR